MSTADAGNVTEAITSGANTPDETHRRATSSAEFMSRVVAWPGDDPGFVNLHYSMPNRDGGKDIVTGKPFRDIDQFLGFVGWALKSDHIKEQWYCTSQQTIAGQTRAGKPKAIRLHQNARLLKAIWIDIDVKDDPKCYGSIVAAGAALTDFRTAVGLPPPSAVVKSGGGLHIYWISDRPLTPQEWSPYAHGLKSLLLKHGVKCDAGLTTDDVRLLRVPNTLNYKYDPPRMVELLSLPLTEYDFAEDLAFLAKVAPPAARPVVSLPASFSGKKPVFALTDTDRLSDGIEREDRPLPFEPIVEGCAFIREALATGGKDYAQPMWNLTTLAATFMEDGHALAHKMGNQHAGYSVGDTDALWDRKLRERADRGLGWPSCAAIQASGCGACETCSHFAASKSPLNLALPRTPATNKSKQISVAGTTFRDGDRNGKPTPSLANAVIAIRALGIEASFDLFHRRATVAYNGQSKTIHEGLLTDYTVSAVRSLINNTYEIDCGDANTLAALNEIARDNAYDPVLDLLEDCQGKWDGVRRLDTWAIDYFGCEDTPLNRAIGRNTLIAACRRARDPGCKHDEITVLEGPEGIQKSTAIRILAGDENFNDQSILGASDKEIQEQLEGTWMHENADLAGMRKAEVETVKAFARRQVDRARPAYARVREDRPRRSIEWGTTNNKTYLQSQTGNRCFWPLECGKIDIEALRRDREQLLGEAATYEATGESIGLDQSLWDVAREAQERRRIADPWEDILNPMPMSVPGFTGPTVTIIHKSGDGWERVASADVLLHVLKIPAVQQNSGLSLRLSLVMANIGWERNKSGLVTINGRPARGYIRRTSPLSEDYTNATRPDVRSEATAPQHAEGNQTDEGSLAPINPTNVPAKEKAKKRPAREFVSHKDWLCR